ncbi:MAG: Gfo/Idh/MocA family oxidoreductase, partial [Caulobacteraceae bacterium]
MKKLRAGVLGAGAFGRIHARKYAEDARVHFVGAYDPDDERAQQLADTHGAESFGSSDALLAAV